MSEGMSIQDYREMLRHAAANVNREPLAEEEEMVENERRREEEALEGDCPSDCEEHVTCASAEEMIENEETGGKKGRKLERFDLIPAGPLRRVAHHYGVGAKKYAERNWEKGYDWSLSFGAAQRHFWQWWNGEDYDPEMGNHHLVAVVFHALALLEFENTHPELDDRPGSQHASDES